MRKKTFHKWLILKEFYFSNQLSCADLSERINKSVPFSASILNELVREGYLADSGYAQSTGGRRPAMFRIKPDTAYILSVAMDQLVTRLSLLNMNNEKVCEVMQIALPLHNNPGALTELASKIDDLISVSGVERSKIIGVGIGMPGFIDFEKGLNYSFIETSEYTIPQFLSRKLNLPVFIDNDSSLIALAELKFGIARQRRNAMVINIGWGVGLGMILNGSLFRGHNGFAGEFSHMPLFHNKKLCSCGKTGCLETETSLLIIVQRAIAGLAAGRLSSLANDFPTGQYEADYIAVVQAALKGDQFAIELVSDLGENIGKGVAILIHLMNPETIILSGRGALAGKMLQTPIQQALNKDCIPRLSANTVVELSTLGHEAELVGAASLVMESIAKEKGAIHDVRSRRVV